MHRRFWRVLVALTVIVGFGQAAPAQSTTSSEPAVHVFASPGGVDVKAYVFAPTGVTVTTQSRPGPRFARQWFKARAMTLSSVPGLSQAAATVAEAVKARDRERLAELMADDVSIGEGATRAEFLATLDSAEWEELARVMQVGYRASGERYLAPYTFGVSGSPPRPDDEMAAAIVGAGVRVRSEPRLASPVLDIVSYAIVRRADDDPSGPWRRLVATDGTTGYIDDRYLSPVTISMVVELERRPDGWKIVSIGVAGD